jgi:hypothetical protein
MPTLVIKLIVRHIVVVVDIATTAKWMVEGGGISLCTSRS